MPWSTMRKRLEEEFLAESLRGRIRYYCPVFGERSEEASAVRFDGRELLFGEHFVYDRLAVIELTRAVYKKADLPREKGGLPRAEVWERSMIAAVEKGILDAQIIFFTAHKVINSTIEASLYGENPLARMYAVLDRRTGKRRVKRLLEGIGSEPEWLRQFILIRAEAEGIGFMRSFPP